MKKYIFLFVTMVGLSLQSMGQKDRFFPKSAKLVKVINDVNFRKGPTIDSPKLLIKCRDEINSDGIIIKRFYEGFSWNETSANYTYMTAHPDYLMIIDETAEWYHGYALDSYNKLPEVYVSKKVVRTKPVQKINESYLKKCEVKYSIRNFGKYNGYYIISGGTSSLHSTADYMFIGMCVDGILYGKLFATEVDNTMKERGFAQMPSEYEINDVSNFSDPMIDRLYGIAQSGTVILTAGKVIVYYPKGSVELDGFENFYFSPENLMR